MTVALATAGRVLTQLRRDPRTLVLMLVAPVVIVTVLRYVLDGQPATFDRVGAPLLGLMPFVLMFLVTSITMLRERTSGTLERLLTMPAGKVALMAGYGLAFAAVAAVQATIVAVVGLTALGIDVVGSPVLVVALAIGNGVLGTALGLFVSAFARSEFQAVQFLPLVVFPQLFVCGLFVPRDAMVGWLQTIADVLPLTYAFDSIARASADDLGGRFALDIAVVAGVTVLALVAGAGTLRRRSA